MFSFINKVVNNEKILYFIIIGRVNFKGGDRKGLRVSSGYYTAFIYKSNGSWDYYDDMRDKYY